VTWSLSMMLRISKGCKHTALTTNRARMPKVACRQWGRRYAPSFAAVIEPLQQLSNFLIVDWFQLLSSNCWRNYASGSRFQSYIVVVLAKVIVKSQGTNNVACKAHHFSYWRSWIYWFHAVLALKNTGYGVVVLDNLVYGHRDLVEKVLQVELIVGDTNDRSLTSCLPPQDRCCDAFSVYAYVGNRSQIKYYRNNVVGNLSY